MNKNQDEKNNLYKWSFDVKEGGINNSAKNQPSFLAKLSILYNPKNLEIKYFNYEVKEAKIKSFANDKKNPSKQHKKSRKNFLNSINAKDESTIINLEKEHLLKLNKESKNYFNYHLNSIYKFVFDVKKISNLWNVNKSKVMHISSKENEFHFKFEKTYYFLFNCMMNIESYNALKYFNIGETIEGKKWEDYEEKNYFELYEKLDIESKIEIFIKSYKSIGKERDQKFNGIIKKIDSELKKEIELFFKDVLENDLITDKWYSINDKPLKEIVNYLASQIVKKKWADNNEDNDKKIKYLKDKILQMLIIEAESNLNKDKLNTLQLEDKKNKSEIKAIQNLSKLENNIIYYGVPGTGKTYYSLMTALWIIEGNSEIDLKLSLKNQVKEWWSKETKKISKIDIEKKIDDIKKNNKEQLKIITFHQNYGYEDFIETIRPAQNLDDDKKEYFKFECRDGVLKEMVKSAKNNPDKKYVLIIDEINRGNISKIFGECFTLIETSKRLSYLEGEWKGAWKVVLPISRDDFGIPNNLYIIGTMNDSDYSITHFDSALRRRFIFEEIKPDEMQIENPNAKNFFNDLNKKIKKLGKQIGHSYFMDIENDSGLCAVWNSQIKPLLKYDFHLDEEKLKEVEDMIVSKIVKN